MGAINSRQKNGKAPFGAPINGLEPVAAALGWAGGVRVRHGR
jgi:hypothetical protein